MTRFDFLSVFKRDEQNWHSMEYPLQLLNELPTPHIVYWDEAFKRYAITAAENEDYLIRMEGVKVIARTSGLSTIQLYDLRKLISDLT